MRTPAACPRNNQAMAEEEEEAPSRTDLEPLFKASESRDLKQALESLVIVSRTVDGRENLASSNILPVVLHLIQSLSHPSRDQYLLLLSLKLLRNLCAGEISNQNSFIELDGPAVVSTVLMFELLVSDPDRGIIRMGLQVLANASLSGQQHQQAVWDQFFPDVVLEIARVRSRDTCDPLCMIVYTCCHGNPSNLVFGDGGLLVVTEIVRTASLVGFGEDWFKLLLSRLCLEDSHFPQLFSKLSPVVDVSGITLGASVSSGDSYAEEQAYLLSVVSEILTDRLKEIIVPHDLALCVFRIFQRSIGVLDSVSRAQSALPTRSAPVDVLGYSLAILKDVCATALNGDQVGLREDVGDVVDALMSSGLLDLLLSVLRDLEPPAMIRKAMKYNEKEEEGSSSSCSSKVCPYKGFRRDIVAVIGNCAFQRKHVQDEIRQKNGILLMLQQCVTDEDNPFLREWGIWSVRNLLERNAENQRAVAELELQASVDMPELAGLGLRVEVDERTRRAKLVNI